jgi:diguanylate cyclase (GGDEF)-like protein
MEDFQSQQLQALSAHLEGLRAALEALPTDPESGASLRRIARSLSAALAKAGATDLAASAKAIHSATDAGLEDVVHAFLRQIASLPEEDSDAEGVQVLLVEDNRTIATAVAAYLKGPGHTVHLAGDAAAAERILAEQPIDIVLLDLILPDRDGRDLLVQMREDRATADIPVIVLSAKEGAVPKAECLAVGAAEFLEKPVSPKVLRTAVARYARRPSAAPQDSLDSGQPALLPGRAALVEAYEPLRMAAGRGAPAAVALLSMNDFPAVTNALGDEAADSLLTRVAAPVGEGLGDGETLGRWGRSELLMLLPRTTAEDAKRKLRTGMARLAASRLMEELVDSEVEVSFSAGVAVAEGSEDLRDVVSAAEESMYRARSAGQGVIVTAEEPTEPQGPRRVLLVEDDRVTSTLIHHRLTREGFEVMDFLNGEDAFEWAEEGLFDLAILDVKVPGMDGFELLERLRGIARLDAVPIVMLTGLGGESDVIRGLELGANDYMLKPFSPTELLARVRRLVYGSSGSSEAGGPRGAPAEAAAH